jgi:glycosyltransferase involved in cell wall biosynthesis
MKLFIFHSLHDSSGNVIMEPFFHGLSVLCQNSGGPGVLVDDTCGIALDTSGHSVQSLINAMTDSLVWLFADRSRLARLSAGAQIRARERSWDALAEDIYAPIELGSVVLAVNYQPAKCKPVKAE